MLAPSENQKNKSIKFQIIFLLFLSFLIQPSISQEYSFKSFSPSEGFSHQFVYSIFQDMQGYLWIGTSDGLSRYNGFGIETFTTIDSLAENFITSGIADGNHKWFGHTNGGITFYDGNEFRKIRCNWEKPGPVTHFTRDPQGRIWVSSLTNGIARLNNDMIVAEGIIHSPDHVYTFEFIGDNEVIIGCSSGLLHCRPGADPGTYEFKPVPGIAGSKVTAVNKNRSGDGFLIAMENGEIFELFPGEDSLSVKKIFGDLKDDLKSVQSLYQDPQGNIWLGTFGNGLIKISYGLNGESKMTLFNQSTGFLSDNVKTVYGDREGNIWSGSFGDGLTQVYPKLFSSITFDRERYGNEVFSISADQNYCWIGTGKGLIKTDPVTGRVIRFYGRDSGLTNDTITAIYSQGANSVWIGTEKSGLYLLNYPTDKISGYPISEGDLENSVTALTGKGDDLWVGTRKGLCYINTKTKDQRWYTVSQGGLPHNHVNSIYLDKGGKLWVSTKSNILTGIYQDNLGKMPLSTGRGILLLGPVTEDSESRMWVGSQGNGIFIIGNDSVFHISAKENLLSDYCYSLISDAHNNIWVAHRDGLSRISSTDMIVKPIRNFEGIAGDYHLNAGAIILDRNQNLWLGSDKGLICYNQSMELPYYEPPALSITSVWINDQEKQIENDRIVLSPGNYKIRIEYLGISFKDPLLVSYQYRLQGFDQWSDITKDRSVTYSRLTNGEYLFLLKAASGDGVSSLSPLALQIVIKKPVWKKWWFYVILLMTTGLLVYIAIQQRIRILVDEKRILEEKVFERTSEIQMQKKEIEEQRDLIKEKNINITSSITYAGNIQNAMLTPADVINRIFPENFILSKPKDIVSGDFYWVTEKNNIIVAVVADCTGHGVPGAFMSVLGITLLNEIVNSQGITQSDLIMSMLRDRVIQSLQQNRKDHIPLDGMDISLIVLDWDRNKLQFTGAMNDLVYVSNGKINVFKADHMGIGAAEFYGKFSSVETNISKGDMIYLFSDGYKDQFGGLFNKKISRSHFYTSLLEVSPLPVPEQKEFLVRRLQNWMKDHPQTDDITVMGIRL